jgi:ABC-type lipoprotein export system ATPase subunit
MGVSLPECPKAAKRDSVLGSERQRTSTDDSDRQRADVRCRSLSFAIGYWLLAIRRPRVICRFFVAEELLAALGITQRSDEADTGTLQFTYRFQAGRFYKLAGPEKGGKHLALQILGLRLEPEGGELRLEGQRVTGLDTEVLSEIRNQKFGFLFSAPFLLPSFNVLENVAMPLFKIAQVETREAKRITEEILDLIGIMPIVEFKPTNLAPLEQTLAALARAVVHHPRLLIVEELGQNLDADSADFLQRTIRRIPEHLGIAVIATCALQVQNQAGDVVLEFDHGKLKESVRQDRRG